MLDKVSAIRKPSLIRIRRELLSIALATGFAIAGPAVQLSYGQESGRHPFEKSFFSCDCDSGRDAGSGGETGECHSLFGGACRGKNPRREKGTVGTMLQWSASEEAVEVAQLDEPLMSDRPDFTEASTVVGLGVLQIESGYTYTVDNDGTSRTIGHSYPETLLRYGLFANWFEFRFATNYSNIDVDGLRTRGTDDLYIGFKLGLTPQEGWRPEMALVPQMTVPSGSTTTTSGEVLPGLNWLYGWDLSERISTAGSTQFNRELDETTNASFTEWAQSWTVGFGLTEKLGGYTEWYGIFPAGAETAQAQHYFNGGLTYSLSNDVQWDIRAGKGLNDAADNYFVGTGLVLRFD